MLKISKYCSIFSGLQFFSHCKNREPGFDRIPRLTSCLLSGIHRMRSEFCSWHLRGCDIIEKYGSKDTTTTFLIMIRETASTAEKRGKVPRCFFFKQGDGAHLEPPFYTQELTFCRPNLASRSGAMFSISKRLRWAIIGQCLMKNYEYYRYK